MPTECDGSDFGVGIYPSAGRAMDSIMSEEIRLNFKSNGTWQRRLADLSECSTWSGRMNFIRMDLFNNSGVGHVGEGLAIRQVRFFRTEEEANDFVMRVGESVPGDVNGDGQINVTDAILILKHIAGWNTTIDDVAADVNKDGRITILDAVAVLRMIASSN